ncbi:MAG: CDGSH iron-sulfur domain-containing protein [Candidatus Margulisiibacteriota bacterium]
MTSKPIRSGNQAIQVTLYPGTYLFCTCGKSIDQPWCDGAHAGSAFQPKRFKVSEPKVTHLCLCKQTRSAPFCDGAHKDRS